MTTRFDTTTSLPPVPVASENGSSGDGETEQPAQKSGTKSRVRPMVAVGKLLTIVGLVTLLFFVYLVVASNYTARKSQRILYDAFTVRMRNAIERQEDVEPRGVPVAYLEIPDLDVKAVAVEGTGPEYLAQGPGHYVSTPLPGQVGNSAFAAHRVTYSGPFRRIDDLREGDRIVATSKYGTFTYKVTDTRTVRPGQDDALNQSPIAQLTLTTSNPAWLPRERLVVVAELDGKPVEAPLPAQIRNLNDAELGLAGDRSAWWQVILWGELLLALIVGARLLYRRWRPVSTWVLTTPPIVAAGFLLYNALARLLATTL